MRENDVALVIAEFTDMVVGEAIEEVEAVVKSWQPKVAFSDKYVNVTYAVLSTAMQLRDLKSLGKRYEHNEDGRTANVHVLHDQDTAFNGSSRLTAWRLSTPKYSRGNKIILLFTMCVSI